jgi:hypothetical protein
MEHRRRALSHRRRLDETRELRDVALERRRDRELTPLERPRLRDEPGCARVRPHPLRERAHVVAEELLDDDLVLEALQERGVFGPPHRREATS